MNNRSIYSRVFILIFTLVLAGCGGDSGGDADQTVASVVIRSGSQLLTSLGETRSLSAQAYNAAGNPVDANITWTTSHPDNISVDTITGEVTANAQGSAVITAWADGVDSPPAMMVYATPVIGAVLVSDAQIVSEPALVDPNAVFDMGVQFTVTLSGIDPPTPGSILMGSQSTPLAGRVVRSTTVGNDVVVTLEIVPINEMFDNLVMKETFDLSQIEPVISPAVARYYHMIKQADGTLVFDLNPGAVDPNTGSFVAPGSAPQATAVSLAGPVQGTRVISDFDPFECESSLPSLNNILSITPGSGANSSITIKQNIGLIFDYDQSLGGLQKIGLGGDLGAEFSNKFTIAVQLDSKITCKVELFQKNLPLPGPIGFLLGAQIPFGLGGEIGGKITVADTGYELKAKLGAHVEGALLCNLGSCGTLDGGVRRQTDRITGKKIDYVTWEGKVNLLGTNTLTADLRFEPSLSGFGYMEIKFGNPLFKTLQFSMVEARLGPTQQASLALVDSQIVSANYKSDYKLTYDLKISLGSDINKVMKLFKKGALPFSTPGFSIGSDLATSPVSQAATADVATFAQNDTVTFNVKLDPASVNYLGLYNVDEVIIYRRPDSTTLERIASLTATDGQTEFTIPWTADRTGATSDLYAFVKTRLSLLPSALADLELGKVKGPAITAGKIAFMSGRDGNFEIYVMNADGSGQTNLTNNAGQDLYPVWSPDGTKIAFIADRNNITDIYVMNADGTGETNLTNNASGVYASSIGYPVVWSPDGTKIAFIKAVKFDYAYRDDLYVMNANGGGQTKLTNNGTYATAGGWAHMNHPVWSPDSTKIAFYSDRDGPFDIYVMDANGGGETRLTNTTVHTWPQWPVTWSPDGTKIAFVDLLDSSIYVMNADGSGRTRLTNSAGVEWGPSWSPDGTKIAFYSDRDGNANKGIYVMNVDGTNQTNLFAYSAGEPYAPSAWSPDSAKIAYSSGGIYVINADGTGKTKLTNGRIDKYPVWQP